VNQNPLKFADPLGLQATTAHENSPGWRSATFFDLLNFTYNITTTAVQMCTSDDDK